MYTHVYICVCKIGCVAFQLTVTPFGGLGVPNIEQMAAMGLAGTNMSQQVRINYNRSFSCFTMK